MKQKINGLEVDNITYQKPGNNLPKFVREAAATRGYGDATQPLSLFIQKDDINEAFACAAQGNGSACVMAQAGKRIGAKAVYFYRTAAWVDFGEGPIVRFRTGESVYNNVIVPIDKGDRSHVIPGIYHLTPPTRSKTLKAKRKENRKYKRGPGGSTGTQSMVMQTHTERIVMAQYAQGDDTPAG